METIPRDKCRKIGFLKKRRGVKGELILEFETDFIDSVARSQRFFIEISGLLVPFFVSEGGVKINTDKTAFIHFDWIDDEKSARHIAGSHVYLFSSEIPDSTEDDLKDIVTGYLLEDENSANVGIIGSVNNYSENIVLSVISRGKEILIPFNNKFLISVDYKRKILKLNIPDGILD